MAGTIRRTRDCGMRYGTNVPELAILESGPSRRITVMRLGTGTLVQPANISVTRRRSARPLRRLLEKDGDHANRAWPPRTTVLPN